MKRIVTLLIACTFLLTASAQNRYIVKTKGAKKVETTKTESAAADAATQPDHQDFLSRYFKYVSLCEWQPGMRFMVIPDQKDMVIKTFNDSTGKRVSSMPLRYKIMTFEGVEKKEGRYHDHVYFHCEDNGQRYYFEVPSGSFENYCYGKFGIPTLAYLGDVDTAIDKLTGKRLYTLADRYYQDSPTDADGVVEVKVKKNTPVKVVAVGVGTRDFPVKIIVADNTGREFFQNVCISRTNCGLRDIELEVDNVRHTFRGSFTIPDENAIASDRYSQYIGAKVYTSRVTDMADDDGTIVKMARLSSFTMTAIRASDNERYAVVELEGDRSGKKYRKRVRITETELPGNVGERSNEFLEDIFVIGDPTKMKNVRTANLYDMQRGMVNVGFNEEEVVLAIGEPDVRGEVVRSTGLYCWTYRKGTYSNVWFDAASHRVKRVKKSGKSQK